jgi:hypothetical protein
MDNEVFWFSDLFKLRVHFCGVAFTLSQARNSQEFHLLVQIARVFTDTIHEDYHVYR